jgi:peptide chain release factor 2
MHKNWVAKYDEVETLIDDTEIFYEYFKEGEATEEEVDDHYAKALEAIEDAEFRSTLNRPEDELGVILEVNAGAGGTEACDWAAMLLRMYKRYGERQGFKVSTLNLQDGDVAGIKSGEIEIIGDFAFGMLKGENGVHRLVRISPFNAQGKRMTSFASVLSIRGLTPPLRWISTLLISVGIPSVPVEQEVSMSTRQNLPFG